MLPATSSSVTDPKLVLALASPLMDVHTTGPFEFSILRFPFTRCTFTDPKLVFTVASPPTSFNDTRPFPVVALTPLRSAFASIDPNDVLNSALPFTSLAVMFPLESSTCSDPPICSTHTSPNEVFTYASYPVGPPFTFPFVEVHFTYPVTFVKLIAPKLPVSVAAPCTVSTSIWPLLLFTERSPWIFRAVTDPNELLTVEASASVNSTAPLPPEISTC